MELKKGDLFAGQRVSSDHYQSSCPGRLYLSRGATNPDNMFHGGTIFVDNATGYINVRHQVSLGSSETIKSKLGFERDAHDSGVVIESYHTDNRFFTSKTFMEVVLCQNQKVRFSGVGAAHQNGVSEWAIRTIMTMARTMLLHAAMHAPDLLTKEL